MLLQGADFLTGRKIADEPLPPAKSLLAQPKVHQHEPLQFTIPENTAGQAKRKGRSKAAAALGTPAEEVVVTAVEGTPIETTSGPHLQQETCFVSIAPKTDVHATKAVSTSLPKTTNWWHRKREKEASEGNDIPRRKYSRTKQYNICKKCGNPRIALNGHSQFKGVIYCPSFEKVSKQAWLLLVKELKKK